MMNDKRMLHDNKDVCKQEKFEKNSTLDKKLGATNNKQGWFTPVRLSSFDKKLGTTGILLIVVVYIIAFMLESTPDINTSNEAADALKSGFSTSLSLGTVVLKKDTTIQRKDYVITHSSNQRESKIWVWDYAAEDGDYVQIIVNGHPIGDAFFIRNKPAEFTVPSVGSVQIKGVRDGGGGITYAVKYELNGVTYFNNAPINNFNTYTLSNNFD
ncbi:MAG: hypothetical protein LBI78_01365 [Campylobacteraceae bacterium]|jgi:hypothetical protein|nr:hypothetical protein [Campylobacteraceae bacterium]